MSITVKEYFGIPKSPKGDIGVEIEVEMNNRPPDEAVADLWLATHDGSLRGECREYVMPKPLSLMGVASSVSFLQTKFKEYGTEVKDTVRAGVHVHLNVNSLTMNELFAFVAVYYVFEELFTRWCGKGRQGNQFALRAMDAYAIVDHLNSFFQTGKVGYLATDDIRYAACNFVALRKYGSLEFRQLGTPKNFSRIVTWARLLHTLKNNSLANFSHPAQVVTDFSGLSYNGFIHRVLPSDLSDEFVFAHGDYEAAMRRGIRFVQDWAFECPREWKIRTRSAAEPYMTISAPGPLFTLNSVPVENDADSTNELAEETEE